MAGDSPSVGTVVLYHAGMHELAGGATALPAIITQVSGGRPARLTVFHPDGTTVGRSNIPHVSAWEAAGADHAKPRWDFLGAVAEMPNEKDHAGEDQAAAPAAAP